VPSEVPRRQALAKPPRLLTSSTPVAITRHEQGIVPARRHHGVTGPLGAPVPFRRQQLRPVHECEPEPGPRGRLVPADSDRAGAGQRHAQSEMDLSARNR